MRDEIVIKCNETFNCGWYVKRLNGGYLHKDLIWRGSTGYNSSSCRQFGDAPGYYITEAGAIEYLQKYLCKESHKIRNLAIAYGIGQKRLKELSERGQNMKKGDVVVAHDLSWAQAVKNGKLTYPSRDVHVSFTTLPAVVVETNCRFPLNSSQPDRCRNDTVVQVINTGEVIFIHETFLQLAKYKITVDDKTVEISHESFEAFKKQFIN